MHCRVPAQGSATAQIAIILFLDITCVIKNYLYEAVVL